MDRLSTIEDVIATMLESIDGSTQSNGYTYYSTTGQVSIEDEAIASSVNRSLGEYANIDYTIEQDGSEINDEWGEGPNVYTNTTRYRLLARVKNKVNSPNPKRDIKQKCNEVLSDLKYLFASDTTLDGNANWFRYDESTRVYHPAGTVERAADLYVYFELSYAQGFSNPDIVGCN